MSEGAPAEPTTASPAAGRIFAALLKSWWILLLAAILGGAGAFLYSNAQTPIFQSTSSTYFSMRSGTSGSDINQGSAYTQAQMLSFAELAMSAEVLQPVIDEVGGDVTLRDLRRSSTVSIPQDTVVLEITVRSADPERAAALANGIAESLSDAVAEIAPTDSEGDVTIEARVIDPAVVPSFQSSPNKQRDALLGAVGGGALAVAIIAIMTLLDTRVRSEAVLRRVTNLPVLGRIPNRREGGRTPVVAIEPNGQIAEAFRSLRSTLRFAEFEHPIRSIAITSSIPSEGKTTAAVNLALAYAESGLRVLLVDADLRRPAVAATLGLENAVGLTGMLVGSTTFDDAKLTWGDPAISILPAGEVAPNAAQLLASSRISTVLEELQEGFDIMIVDTAPLLSVADATMIAQSVDATLLVVDTKHTRVAQVDRALTSFLSTGADVAGVVLTRIPERRSSAYHYGAAGESKRS